jgi:hypothetical protein
MIGTCCGAYSTWQSSLNVSAAQWQEAKRPDHETVLYELPDGSLMEPVSWREVLEKRT